VPGGFGERGSEGKKIAIRYARENGIPFLGICFGFQLMLVEYAQHVLGIADANTTEFEPECKAPVIDLLHDQYAGIKMGGTMRLGLYDCHITKGSLAYRCYGNEDIKERHRHRYEFNNHFKEQFEQGGIVFSGINPQASLAEIAELPSHPFFIACQFHPEFTSRPLKPNPLFREFVAAAIKHQGK
jgi:CTP synthase